MDIIFNMPSTLNNNTESLEKLIDLNYNIKELKDDEIIIDFRNTKWIDSNIFAILGLIFNYSIQKNNKIKFRFTMNNNLFKMFDNIGFIKNKNYNENYYLGFREFTIEDTTEFEEYLDKSAKNMFVKNIEEIYTRNFKKVLVECFSNIKHTTSKTVIISGGVSKKYKKVSVSICNLGRTILENYNCRYFQDKFDDDIKAIKWAIQARNTTKLDSVGGLGLYILYNFVKNSKGELWIISGRGYYYIDFRKYAKIETYITNKKFDGTIITLKIPNYLKNINFSMEIDEMPELNIDNLKQYVDII